MTQAVGYGRKLESKEWEDTGCVLHSKCTTCPLPECVYMLSAAERMAIIDAHGWRCAACGKEAERTTINRQMISECRPVYCADHKGGKK